MNRADQERVKARLAEAIKILTKVSECCAADRYENHGFGETPKFIGCPIYRKQAENEWCGPCEAMVFLSSLKGPL